MTGYCGNSVAGDAEDFLTVKYSPTGEQFWVNRYNSQPVERSAQAHEMEINAPGDVIVMGLSDDFIDAFTSVQKINGTTGDRLDKKSPSVGRRGRTGIYSVRDEARFERKYYSGWEKIKCLGRGRFGYSRSICQSGFLQIRTGRRTARRLILTAIKRPIRRFSATASGIILRSSDNGYTITQFGLTNDIPIPAAY